MVNIMGSRVVTGHCHFAVFLIMYAVYGTNLKWRGRSIKTLLNETGIFI